jgi:riboflavin biosynthesis pyrimidine reductase
LENDLVFSVWHPELVALRLALQMPRHPIQIVITASGNIDVPRHLLFNVEDLPVIVMTSPTGAGRLRDAVVDRPWIQLLDAGMPLDLPRAFDRIRRDRGVRRISAVGGRMTATALIDAHLVDDLYLTTSPVLGGQPGTPFYSGAGFAKRLCVKKEGLGSETGVVFEHFVLRRA